MLNKEKKHKYYNYIALRTTLIYAILSILWILFSDQLLLTNPATAIYISTIKGWFYTIIVGIFIYFTLARELNKITAAENEIKQFQQLLQSSIDSQKDTILVSIDKNYNCLYFNKAFFEVIKYAYGTEIKLGMNVLDVMTSDEDKKAAKKSYDRALQGESHSTIRIYGDTNLAYYEGFFNPIITESGEIIGATTLARNITERKNMEEKNKWLASFPLLNPWPVIEIDKNVGLVFINDSAKKTFPDLEDKNINHPFIKDLKKYFTELSTGDNFQSKREIKIGDLFYLQAITLVNKQQLRIYAIDITNVKQAEEVLGDEKEKYQKLFYNMINGFAYHQIITDKKGQPIDYKFLEVNPAFEQMTGLKRENIINKLVTKVLPGTQEDEANWIGRYGKIALTGQGKSFEDYSKALNKWFNISAYSPHTGYFATIFEDITARKENEQRLLELDRLKDNFLSVTTHELKTPLIPIKSQTQLLLAGDYGPLNIEQKHALEMIERNEENLNRLTSDLMDISKIKSNKLNIILGKTSLSDIITNAIKDAEKIAQEKNINISLSLNINTPIIIIDKLRITQVFNNLIGNALKFTPDGGQINIDVKNINNDIVITIKDTGIGLDPENLTKLFTPFFQVQNDLNRKYRGTGLGLAISKGIIEAHGGKMWAESAGEAQGSSFIFTLPINK